MNEENIMGTEPIAKLIRQIGAPMILSLLCNALYNVVDSVFVSHIEENALTALSLAAPLQNMMSALGCGIAVGLNAVISKALGEKNEKKVYDAARASTFLAFCAWVLNIGLCLLLAAPYFRWQAGGNSSIYQHGIIYLRIVMLLSIGQMGQWVFDRFLIATGKSKLFLVTLATASIVNLILDPILIFGFLGFPAMGTAGAAVATVIGQFCGAIAGIIVNKKWNRQIPVVFLGKVDGRSLVDILKVGIPTSIMQGIVSLNGIMVNTILQGFSYTAVAVMGICNRIAGLATIPIGGINCGLIPLIAYNYGARKPERIYESIRVSFRYDFTMMAIVWFLLTVFARPVLLLFDASPEMIAIGIPAIRIFAVAYFLATVGFVYSTVFQALGRGDYSMCLTITRQVVLPIVLAYALSQTGMLVAVWAAFVLAELLSIPISLFFMKKAEKYIKLEA